MKHITIRAEAYLNSTLDGIANLNLKKEQEDILRFAIFIIYYLENVSSSNDAVRVMEYDLWIDSIVREINNYLHEQNNNPNSPFIKEFLESLISYLGGLYMHLFKNSGNTLFLNALQSFLHRVKKMEYMMQDIEVIIGNQKLEGDDLGVSYDYSLKIILDQLRELLYIYKLDKRVMREINLRLDNLIKRGTIES